MEDAIGWLSSFLLVLTIARQVYRQWRSGTSEGVSKWLFIGQAFASVGFTVYSVMIESWVFVVTNSLMLVNALLGLAIVLHHKRKEAGRAAPIRDEATHRPHAFDSPLRVGA